MASLSSPSALFQDVRFELARKYEEGELQIPVALVVHDDWFFLGEVIRAYKAVGPVTVFLSVRAWNGDGGFSDKCVSEAESVEAEVIIGDWPDEATHRRVALDTMRQRGHRHILIPDGDEIPSAELLNALVNLASFDAADVVRVSMETYWKSPRYRIHPPEQLRPVMMVNAQTTRHVHIREYDGPRLLVLGPDHGVLHHLSYAGPDERIKRKLDTWGHRSEVVRDWYSLVWKGWDHDRLMRDLHPTHPTCYGYVERIKLPEELRNCRDDLRIEPEIQVSRDRWPKISVVVPLYGGEEDIRLCLQSLDKFRDLLHEAIVVDDVSPDGAAGVAAEFNFVTLLRNEANSGFAATCNRGYAASTGEVIVFLNSDTIVPRSGLIRLVESLTSSGSIAAAGPRSNYCAGSQRIDPTYSRLENLDLFAEDFAHRENKDRDTSLLIGFCLAVRREALEEVAEIPGQAFDERFGRGMYEDNNLSYRFLRAGFRLRIAERAYVHHGGSHSLRRMPESFISLIRRNQGIFHDKWREDVESGFASHLSREDGVAICFNQDRHPDVVRAEIARLREQADISLCMIVRDEERVIGDCLRSAAGYFNQIVIIDTGSTDRTREIIQELRGSVDGLKNLRLEVFPWTESFSEARNESLKYAKSRWIFWMDADDTLPRASAEAILRGAVSAQPNVAGFVVPVRFVDGGATGGTQVDHVKLFRNLPGVRFEGRIHEQILSSLRVTGGQIARLDAVVLHSGYDTSPAGQAKKRVRDERLLMMDLDERPGHPFVLFNLGMTAHYLGGHAEAVDWLSRSILAAGPGESHVRKAYALMGLSHRELGDLEGALRTYSDGLAVVGEDPELRFQSALVLSALGRWEEAKSQYVTMGTDVGGFFSSVDIGILGPKRAHNLGTVCLALRQYAEARVHFCTAIQMGFTPAAQALFEAAMERDDYRTANEAMDNWRMLAPADPSWAEALVSFSEKRLEDPETSLHRLMKYPGAALVLVRRMLARGEEPAELLAYLDEEGCAEAAFYRSVACSRRGDFAMALKHMRRARDLNPSHAMTREQAGKLESAVYDLSSPLRCPDEEIGRVTGPHVGQLDVATCPISVVIVTYNSEVTLDACLRSVLASLGPEDEVIVVDNNSADETGGLLDSFSSDPRVVLQKNVDNIGYARAANQGLLLSHGEHLVLLNPDAIVSDGWIEGLRSRLTENVVAVGPVSDRIGGDQALTLYMQGSTSIGQATQALRLAQNGRTELTKLLFGVCLMVPRWVLDRYGLLEESTELGADDLELSWRLRVLGYDLAIACDVFVSHVGSVSFASLPGPARDERVGRSDQALIAKLRDFYGTNGIPSSWALWGCDVLEQAMVSRQK